jgi:hypothetical protein
VLAAFVSPADVAMSLCRMVAYNIGQLAYMHAKRYDLKRVFFGGFFIRGHPYTMETISFAIKFWSQVRAGWCVQVQKVTDTSKVWSQVHASWLFSASDRHHGDHQLRHQVLEPGARQPAGCAGSCTQLQSNKRLAGASTFVSHQVLEPGRC